MEKGKIKLNSIYDDLLKSGKIIPIEFNFPSFSIDNKIFKKFAVEGIEEKILNNSLSINNISAKEFTETGLKESCVKTMEYILQNIVFHKEFQIDLKEDLNKFVATLIVMNFEIPQIHKNVLQNVKDYENILFDIKPTDIKDNHLAIEIVNYVKDNIKKPSNEILNIILNNDNKYEKSLIESYPEQYKQLYNSSNKKTQFKF